MIQTERLDHKDPKVAGRILALLALVTLGAKSLLEWRHGDALAGGKRRQ